MKGIPSLSHSPSHYSSKLSYLSSIFCLYSVAEEISRRNPLSSKMNYERIKKWWPLSDEIVQRKTLDGQKGISKRVYCFAGYFPLVKIIYWNVFKEIHGYRSRNRALLFKITMYFLDPVFSTYTTEQIDWLQCVFSIRITHYYMSG